MAEKIKKYFQKKKADAKFKLAGPGYKLNEETTSRRSNDSGSSYNATRRSAPSTESRQAAAAALARLGEQRQPHTAINTYVLTVMKSLSLVYC